MSKNAEYEYFHQLVVGLQETDDTFRKSKKAVETENASENNVRKSHTGKLRGLRKLTSKKFRNLDSSRSLKKRTHSSQGVSNASLWPKDTRFRTSGTLCEFNAIYDQKSLVYVIYGVMNEVLQEVSMKETNETTTEDPTTDEGIQDLSHSSSFSDISEEEDATLSDVDWIVNDSDTNDAEENLHSQNDVECMEMSELEIRTTWPHLPEKTVRHQLSTDALDCTTKLFTATARLRNHAHQNITRHRYRRPGDWQSVLRAGFLSNLPKEVLERSRNRLMTLYANSTHHST